MRVASQADIPAMEAVINHPECRTFMGPGANWLKVREDSFDGNSLCFIAPGMVVQAEYIGRGCYCAMVAATPSARGITAVVEGRRILRYLFTVAGCTQVVATVDVRNEDGVRFASALGFTPTYVSNLRVVLHLTIDTFITRDGEFVNLGHRVLEGLGLEPLCREEAGALGYVVNSWDENIPEGWVTFNACALLSHLPELVASDPEYTKFVYRGKLLDLDAVTMETYMKEGGE